MDNTQTQSIDPTALALKRSIFKTEGGDYTNTSGDSGTSAGAGQWNNGKIPLKKGEIPANFKSDAQQFGLDPNDFSETAQDHIGYLKIKKDLDSGLTQSQIAAKWNSGLTHGWENHVGDVQINGKTVHYDTPSYVDKVKKYYEEEMGGGTSETPKRKTFTESLAPTPTENNPAYTTPEHSPERLAQYQAEAQTANVNAKEAGSADNIANDTIAGIGDALSFGGASKLGNELGTGFANSYNKLKGVLGGQDNSKYIPEMSFGNTATGLAGTVGGILASAAPELKGVLSKGSALANPEISTILEQRFGSNAAQAVSNLPKAEVVNTLARTLDELSIGEANGAKGKAILQALEELNPTETAKQSLLKRLIKQGISETTRYILYNALGNKLGGIAHGLLPK